MLNQDIYKKQSDAIWDIANLLRGPYRPPQYRRVMIPFTVLRRLDCVLEATKEDVLAEYKRLKAQTNKEGEPLHSNTTIEKLINHKFQLTFFGIVKLVYLYHTYSF